MAQRKEYQSSSAGMNQKFNSTVTSLGSIHRFSHQHQNAEHYVKIETKPVRILHQMIPVEFNHNSVHAGKPRQVSAEVDIKIVNTCRFNKSASGKREPVQMEREIPVLISVVSKQPSHNSFDKAKLEKDGYDGGGGSDDDKRHEAECTFYINKVKQRMMDSVLSCGVADGASSGRDKIGTAVLVASKENI